MAGIFAAVGVRLIRGYWPVYSLAALSLLGAAAMAFLPRRLLLAIFDEQWSVAYLLVSPFLHDGLLHAVLNIFMLHFIGGQLMLPLLGARRFLLLFAAAALAGGVINNLFSPVPAIGISAAVLAMLSCAVYPYGRLPMKLLLIHDMLRLRPFPLWTVVAFVVCLDIMGIIFGWRVFAHWAHLAGVATGAVGGWIFFGRRRIRRRVLH